MTDNEKVAFSRLLAGLCEYYKEQITEAVADIYWEMLKEYSLEEVHQAAKHILSTHKYPNLPKVSVFIEFIHPPEELDSKSVKATEELMEHLIDGYNSFYFNDPVIGHVIRHLGDWQHVFEHYPKTAEAENWWIKDFERLYKIYARRPESQTQIKMVGIFESTNTQKGYLTDDTGKAIEGDVEGGFLKIGSPEAQKYLEEKKNKLMKTKETK